MTHTPGAVRAATIIMAGRVMLETRHGIKSAEGLADLIDTETAAPDLLAAANEAADSILSLAQAQAPHHGAVNPDLLDIALSLRAAIAKATFQKDKDPCKRSHVSK